MYGLGTMKAKNAEESVRRAIRRRGAPLGALLHNTRRANIIADVHDPDEQDADITQWDAVIDRVAIEECKCSPY